MAKKMTKTEQRRAILSVMTKTQRLFMQGGLRAGVAGPAVVTGNDMIAVEKLCTKWLKRLG